MSNPINPFKSNSTQYKDFETMSDLQWHCTKCELKSGQAKTWQVWRQEKGIQLDQDKDGNYFKKCLCKNCNQITIHRKLKSLEILQDTKARQGISKEIANRIKKLYDNEEAVFLRQLSDKELEIDHKLPQIRWDKDELDFSKYSDKELKDKFILLSRSNNLLKSRYCEKCKKEYIRGNFPGIEFWYQGDKEYKGTCEGCFWYDLYKWRKELKIIIDKVKK